MISKVCIISAAATLVSGISMKSKCPFGYTSGKTSGDSAMAQLKAGGDVNYPSQILTCPSTKTKVMQTSTFDIASYESIAKQLIELQYASDDKTKFAACLLRLEGHDLMDLRRETKTWGKGAKKKTGVKRGAAVEGGGSDGCVNFKDGDNAGLGPCLLWTGINQIYENWCDKISLADFMVLAGEAMAGSLAVDYDSSDPFK